MCLSDIVQTTHGFGTDSVRRPAVPNVPNQNRGYSVHSVRFAAVPNYALSFQGLTLIRYIRYIRYAIRYADSVRAPIYKGRAVPNPCM
jgi:hypothetical protein